MKEIDIETKRSEKKPFTTVKVDGKKIDIITGKNIILGMSFYAKHYNTRCAFYEQMIKMVNHLNRWPKMPYILKFEPAVFASDNIKFLKENWSDNWHGVIIGIKGIKQLVITEAMGEVVFEETFDNAVEWVLKKYYPYYYLRG
jgi:hypothetical protein